MLEDRAGLPNEARARLTAIVAAQRTLEEVVRWSAASGAALVDVVTQDEFTHDVVVAIGEDARVIDRGLHLVYDTT
jgi:hypothetical protein